MSLFIIPQPLGLYKSVIWPMSISSCLYLSFPCSHPSFLGKKTKQKRLTILTLVCPVCLECAFHLPGTCSSLSTLLRKKLCLDTLPNLTQNWSFSSHSHHPTLTYDKAHSPDNSQAQIPPFFLIT